MAISRETRRQLEQVPYAGRHGDWDALVGKHSAMLAILKQSHVQCSALEPPPPLAEPWREYLAAVDTQLVYEQAVLAAAESHDSERYREACSELARVLPKISHAAQGVGLTMARTPLRTRARVWVTLPYYIARALMHARAERRAGRTWS